MEKQVSVIPEGGWFSVVEQGCNGMDIRIRGGRREFEPLFREGVAAFALESLRLGLDIFTLQKPMGHADLQVLRRYSAQTTQDIEYAYRRAEPADNAEL